MTDLVRMGVSDKLAYAENMAGSNLLPKAYQRNPNNLLFAIEYAEALGIPPINAITSIHVINGKPTASADLMATLIRRAGHKLRVVGDDTYAEATLIRADDPDFEFKARWDMDKARKAGLNTPTWKSYPAAMLRSRAISEVARQGASDALNGVVYTPEEFGDESAWGKVRGTRTDTPAPAAAAALLEEDVIEEAPDDDPALPPEQLATMSVDGLRTHYTARQNAGATTEELEHIKALATTNKEN